MPSIGTITEDIMRLFATCGYYFGAPAFFGTHAAKEPVAEPVAEPIAEPVAEQTFENAMSNDITTSVSNNVQVEAEAPAELVLDALSDVMEVNSIGTKSDILSNTSSDVPDLY